MINDTHAQNLGQNAISQLEKAISDIQSAMKNHENCTKKEILSRDTKISALDSQLFDMRLKMVEMSQKHGGGTPACVPP